MKFFNYVGTLKELRKQCKELLKKFHPDNPNGSIERRKKTIKTSVDIKIRV